MERMRNWWNEADAALRRWEERHATGLGRIDAAIDILAWLLNWIAGFFTRMIVIAIIMNVIANAFWPELPEKIPTVYQFFNGSLVLIEWVYKNALGGLYAIFSGGLSGVRQFGAESEMELGKLIETMVHWFSGIHF